MPRRRKRRRGVIGKNERYEGRRSRDREYWEKLVETRNGIIRGLNLNVIRRIWSEYEWVKRIDRIVYKQMYDIYRQKVNEAIRSWMYRYAMKYFKQPDATDRSLLRRLLRKIFLVQEEDIFDWLNDYLIYERPLLDARHKLRLKGEVRKYRRIREEFYRGMAVPLLITRYHNRAIDLYFTRYLDKLLEKEEFRPIVLRALHHIFRQLLTTSYKITIPPEELEELKHILAILYRYYVPYTMPMPCTRSQFIFKLTPITLQVAKGYAVRIYVLRWTKADNLHSGLLMITDPVDIYFALLRDKKYRDDIFSTMQIAGDTSYLTEYDLVYTWRDYAGRGRDMLKVYQLMYNFSAVKNGMKRAIGRREIENSIGHCSVYIGFNPSHRTLRNWKYIREKLVCKKYHVC